MSRRRHKTPRQAPTTSTPQRPEVDRNALLLQVIAQAVRQRAERAAKSLEHPKATLTLGDLSASAQEGIAARETAWETQQSLSGIQRASGIVRLERNPELGPYKARGFGSDPGAWWDLRNLPETGAPLARLTREVTATELFLVPGRLPEWATEVDEHLASMQFELASHWWYAWTNDPEQHVGDVARDLMDYAPTCGFATMELTGQHGAITLSDGYTVEALIPNLPAVIAPWSTRYWVTRGREFCGAIYDFSSVQDRDGGRGDFEVFIPAEKLVVVSHDANGQNFEGRSVMRPIFQQLHQLRDLYRLQALGAEIHALGELWFTQQATSGAQGGTAPTVSPEAVAQLIQILDTRAAIYVPGAILPPGVEPVYGQAKANLPDLTPMIRTLREAISLVMGDEHRLMGTGAVGSYAARKDASDDAKTPVDFALETLVARPLEKVLARFLALAFPGAPVFVPRVSWGQVATDRSQWIADVVAAKDAGLLDDPDFGDQMRDALNLPPRNQADLEAVKDPNDLPADRFVPVAKAAEIFGVSAGVIRRLISTGDLVGRKIGGRYSVLVASIRAFIDAGSVASPSGDVVQ